MRTAVKGGNALESALLATGAMPTPMVEGYMPAFGRALLVATDIGAFEALKDVPHTASEVARACGTDARATAALLNLMVAMRYLAFRGDTYRLRGTARRWLLADSPNSLRDAVLMKALEWRWIEHLDAFVRTGRSIDVHASLTPDEWSLYQRGMRSYASTAASVIARFAPIPKGATEMLDIGGSHGYHSVALCRRHPELRATVFDLPGAVLQAAPILAKEGMGDRVVHRAGDALVDDLGEAAYDFILIMSLVHHFDDATNRELIARAARSLRPGGVVLIGDTIRVTNPNGADQMRTFWDLYFAMTSASGTWTMDEMASWQSAAGLRPMKPIRWLMFGGIGLQPAMKLA